MTTPKPVKAWAEIKNNGEINAYGLYPSSGNNRIEVEIMPVEQVEAMRKVIEASSLIVKANNDYEVVGLCSLHGKIEIYDNLKKPKEEK